MDADGGNVKILTDGRDLVLSPRFDNKTHRITYTSFKQKVAKVFLYDLETGRQTLLGQFSGMSFASRFSPGGDALVFSVANNGSTSIYELDIRSRKVSRLTSDRGTISTSPCYSPDGNYIVFSSDRSGSQQLYIMRRGGGGAARISSGRGSYATPVWSPRGDYIAFTKILGGVFYIGVMRPDGKGERLISSSWFTEEPTWSPNGRLLMFFERAKNNKASLYSIDVSGHNKRRMPLNFSSIDPAWSPLLPN